MYSFASAATGGVTDQAWQVAVARSVLSDACEALDAATGLLVSLGVDTEWRSDGISALHRKLAEFQDRTLAAIGAVHGSGSELGGVP
ncbi:hypothetical protein [Microbacterium hydrocarbonoxydans]|uniref:hypothetical protein n=1 Tax=Microbacterium hydrocarbonoxydans TaxID=273678 RepID=UPI0013DA87B4|nr:hypothetical protein [Microbacterium hydrocarbonoxydans]